MFSLHQGLLGLLIAVGVLVGTGTAALAQVSPEESATQVKVAEGLAATLWAAEPLVVNPTTIDIDSKGRVWVTEGLNYRLTKARNQEFTRIGESDKIKILEDTDNNGTADKMTVFAEGIYPVPMGIAVEEHYDLDGNYRGCKVYVGNSPNLMVFEDTDGDDKADLRYPLLTGFGGIDSDHGVHGVVLGLDGKLYFTHGDGCCSVQPDNTERTQNFIVTDESGRTVSSDQLANTLRVNRDGTQFEVIADRQRNNYETSLNSFGNIFTSDNDDDGNRGCRIIWVMDGGTYGYRTPGSPRHWGEEVPGNVPKLVGTGNGSPCGVMVYEGGLLPEEYFGAVLEAEAGTRQINFFPITRQGASFRTNYQVLMSSDDPWFRPVDVTAAPDGSLMVADWYDAGVGGHAFRDQTTGRIYRVAPQGAEPTTPSPDFGTVEGLIEGLKSPNVATQDAARRGLLAQGIDADPALVQLYQSDEPVFRARALWVLNDLRGDEFPARHSLEDHDPKIREQAVRMLGRDLSREGKVELADGASFGDPAAIDHLDVLLPMANDPDPGVRRELILAFRYLPTEKVGEALRTLTAAWDGQDRWYLEALRLGLRDREPEYIDGLFSEENLFGDLDLKEMALSTDVALPPYFPVDRNEAYLSVNDSMPPANALSKSLGLMWVLQRPEALPALTKLVPKLVTPDLLQAATDIWTQIDDPQGANALADLLLTSDDPVLNRQVLTTLARRLESNWKAAGAFEEVRAAIARAIEDPLTRPEAIKAAAASGAPRFTGLFLQFAQDEEETVPVRVAAVEALGALKPEFAREVLEAMVERAKLRSSSDPVSEAALATLPALGVDRRSMVEITTDSNYPLGLRREALRAATQQARTAQQLLDLAENGLLPDELKSEATTILHVHPNSRVRDRARQLLSLGALGNRELPPFYELIRLEGDPDRGREVFANVGNATCASCHRVQGRGQWVGPDLSTIGTKYGKDALLRSILSPSEAIGYNYRSLVVALDDGRVVTGLPVVDTADQLVLKTAEGERLVIEPLAVEARQMSDLSLMPEGLAHAMTNEQIADLLAFLSTLEKPVSIIGEFRAAGPLMRPRTEGPIDPGVPLEDLSGDDYPWRRVRADAEGRVEFSTIAGSAERGELYLHTPVFAPVELEAKLVLDTRANGLSVWLDGKPIEVPDPSDDDPTREAHLTLQRGDHNLIIKLPMSSSAAIVATLVADLPLQFRSEGSMKISTR